MSDLPSPADQSRENLESALLAVLLFLRLTVSSAIHPWTGFLDNALLALLILLLLPRLARRWPSGPALIRAGLALTLAAGMLSTAFALNHHLSTRQFLLDLGGVLVALAVAGRGPRGLRAVAAALVAGAAAGALFALRQHFGGFERTLAEVETGSYAFFTLQQGRVFGLTFSPDMLAAIMAGAMPVAVGLAFATRAGRTRPWWLLPAVAAVVMAGVVVLTRSLGGWIAAGGGMVLWALLHLSRRPARRGRTRIIVSAALLLVLAAGAVLVVVARGGRHLDYHNPENPIRLRLENWREGLDIAREFPLTGAGPGGYQLAVLSHRGPMSNEARHAHNLLVETLSDTGPLGLLGLILLLAGLAAGVRRLAAHPETDPVRWSLRAGLLAGAAAVAAHGLVDFSFEVVETSLFFWVGVGVLLGEEDQDEAGVDSPVPGPSRKAAVGLTAAALVLITVLELFQVKRARAGEAAQQAALAGDWSRAAFIARQALGHDPDNDELLLLLAHAAARLEADPAQAAAYLEQAIAANPRYPFHWRDLGLVLVKVDPTRAEQCLRHAVALYPNSLELNLELGRFLRRAGRLEPAAEALERARSVKKKSAEVYYESYLLARDQGNKEDQEKWLARAAWAPPFTGRTAALYARFLIDQDRKGKALEFLKKYNGVHPGQAEVVQLLTELTAGSPTSAPAP